MDLVDHWVVGFSGKRQLKNPEAVRAAMRDVLQGLGKLTDGQLVAIGSVAIGADSLFVDEAMNVGIPWICVLPFPENAFFNERDFPDPHEREAARQKLRGAADCEVVRIPRSAAELNDSTWRRAAFAEAGFRCVDEADLVITVLHDGAEPGKPGGTGDMVTYARAAKRPLVIIDPDTLEIRRENWPIRLHDPLIELLRRLDSGSLASEDREKLPTPAAIKVAEWRSGFARAARHHVPGIRSGTSAVVILHALATIITASVFLLLHPVNFKPPLGALHTLEGRSVVRVLELGAFLFVLAGFCFLVWLLWKRPQINAANYRLAAEVGRSIIAVWLIPGAASGIIRGLPHGFTHFARTLLLHQRLDPDRPRKGADEIAAEGDVEELAAAYVDQRINPQIKYYSEKYRVSARRARALEIGSIIFSSIAVVSAGCLAFGHAVGFQRALLGLAKLAAATATPVVVSILVIHEVKRREARYHEMQHALEQYGERINQVRSLSALEDLVTDVERMLLSECHEWWVLAKANVAA